MSIRGTICDDVGIVRLFVRKKKHFAFVSISDYLKCYMYGTAKEAFRGIERSIAGVFPPRPATIIPILLIVIIILHMALSPLLSLLFLFLLGLSPSLLVLIAGWALLFLSWYIGCRAANWRKRISIACPLALFQIAMMYLHGLYKQLSGEGFIWKGRKVS